MMGPEGAEGLPLEASTARPEKSGMDPEEPVGPPQTTAFP